MSFDQNDHLIIFKSLFKGREDIFALRWEKNGKSGYMPTYVFDSNRYRLHKIKGGTFQNFAEKSYQPLTDQHIINHLNGTQVVGLYPLLQDNTSWFIAADFDESDWIEECRSFIKICEEYDIPAYLERSRSGNGGHVWIFFDQPYAAFRSRKIITTLLQKVNLISAFDKNSSFDRLFPNQDYLSKKGLGNLIALPLNKTSLKDGNGCFVDPKTLLPFVDQWLFLKTVSRVKTVQLDYIYKEYTEQNDPDTGLFQKDQADAGKLLIKLDNEIHFSRVYLPAVLISFLKEELNFTNNEYLIKKNINKSTFGIKRYFKLLDDKSDDIKIPRGFIGRLLRFCKEQKIDYSLHDERKKVEPVFFKGVIQLREDQMPARDAALKKDFGVIVAPPGAGKTVISLSIIKEKQQPALILVHRKQLADQWIDRIESFLGIPQKEVGRIIGGEHKPGKHITVAMIQSVGKILKSTNVAEFTNTFGTVIIDECHHVPADTYQQVIVKLNSYYMYGLTATPFRKYNDGKLIFIYLGEIIHELKPKQVLNQTGTAIFIKETDLFVPFNIKTDKFETLFKILIHDSARNQLILNDVVSQLDSGKKAVIITERKDHIDSLQQYLKQDYVTISLSGEDSDTSKKSKWAILKNGDFQVLITTGQYFGEGTDIQNIECLFLVYPFAFEGKLIQYIGRVQRSEISPIIYDYRDQKIEYLEKLFQKRNKYYKKLDSDGLANNVENDEVVVGKIDESIEVPIERLEFKFGAISFKYISSFNDNIEIEFEIENLNVRPEFIVLKPYFIRFFKSDVVRISIKATLQNNMLVFKSAFSSQLNKITGEIIETLKFQFLNKGIVKRASKDDENLLDIQHLQGNNQDTIYTSEDDLLNNILGLKQYKHHQHIRYLAGRHDRTIIKLRFVLEPFSFVFLLPGANQYHLVWETLDTEEATYVWHIEKSAKELRQKIKEIDSLLGKIRANGRQDYLETNPIKFTRILHDYSDAKKGFIIWKDLLEAKLF